MRPIQGGSGPGAYAELFALLCRGPFPNTLSQIELNGWLPSN